jgi:hypothetical protein
VVAFSRPHVRTERDPVSEHFVFLFLEYSMMDNVQNPSIPANVTCMRLLHGRLILVSCNFIIYFTDILTVVTDLFGSNVRLQKRVNSVIVFTRY